MWCKFSHVPLRIEGNETRVDNRVVPRDAHTFETPAIATRWSTKFLGGRVSGGHETKCVAHTAFKLIVWRQVDF